MLTAAECHVLANKYKSLARRPGVSLDHAAMLKNIARSLTGLANQLDRLAAHMRDRTSLAGIESSSE